MCTSLILCKLCDNSTQKVVIFKWQITNDFTEKKENRSRLENNSTPKWSLQIAFLCCSKGYKYYFAFWWAVHMLQFTFFKMWSRNLWYWVIFTKDTNSIFVLLTMAIFFRETLSISECVLSPNKQNLSKIYEIRIWVADRHHCTLVCWPPGS